MSEPDQNFIAENDIKSDTKSQPDVASGHAESSSRSARKAVKYAARPGRGLAVMALLLSAGALGLSGYIGWRTMPLEQSQPALEEGMSQLQAQMARQQARLSDVIQGISPLKSHLDELHQREHHLLSRIDSLSGKVRGFEGNTRSQWRLAEVEYLLRLANQRLLTVTDSAGSLELLLSADELLREMDDYALFLIREALAEDIAALKAIQKVDLESAWLRLQGLKELVPKLVLLNENRLNELTPEKTVATASPANNENWQSRLKHLLVETWSRFTDLFRFTAHRKQPIEELLSPEQDLLIRQHLLLLIEQSKLALMTREAAIYQNSLEEASQLLKRYFTLGGQNSRTLSNELQALKQTPAAPELPN
ncbi:MAG: uroporphyrinogen-III C-methyltransferase, partial [Endozoicomonas sp.]